MKTLILGDPTFTFLASSCVPLAYALSKAGHEVDYFSISPVTSLFARHIPYIRDIICGYADSKAVYSIIPFEKSANAPVTHYCYDLDVIDKIDRNDESLEGVFGEEVIDCFLRYDYVYVIYDGDHNYSRKLLQQVAALPNAIGRISNIWNQDCLSLDKKKYIPKEIVEAFGFSYDEKSSKIDTSWYGEVNNFGKRSVYFCPFAGCESHIPFSPARNFYLNGDKLSEILEENGFNVQHASRMVDPRKQFLTCAGCSVSLCVDSVTCWSSAALGKDCYCLSPKDEDFFIQTKVLAMIPLSDKRRMNKIPPEDMYQYFINSLKQRLSF